MRAFAITLQETPERTARAQAHFKERKIAVNFFYGIHAEKFGLATEHTYDVDHPGTGFRIGYKPTGIWLSHYMLWAMLNFQAEEHFIVLEIDANLPWDWHGKVTEALRDTPPDFDMLYIGSCCCAGRSKTHIKGAVYDCKYALCTHAYIVAKKALPILLSTQRRIYAPIDISIMLHSFPVLKTYVVLPRIVEQFGTEISA